MKRLWFAFLFAASLILASSPGYAQVFIVANCGTVPASQATLTAGNAGMLFIDNTGKLCTSSAGGGGGLSVTDQATFTAGSSSFTPGGGVFNDAATLSSGQQGAFRMTTKRAQVVDVDSTGNQLHTDLTAPPTLGSASAGLSTNFQAALTTTVVAVDANPGQLYELYCYNSNASVAFVQLFDLATGSVTLGTTTPKLSYGIPATNASGFTVSLVGTQFSTAISAAVATTATGSGAVGSGLTCNFKYK